MYQLTPDLVLYAYRQGLFPMADPDADDRIHWYAPDPRAVLPLDGFHVPRSLARVVRQGRYRVTTDRAFEAVLHACARPGPGRESTWISEEIVRVFAGLHRRGFAHSVECWVDEDPGGPALAGGLYGVALGGAFFGESMFHRRRDASKVALVHLVDRLRAGGFALLDTQFSTPHLARFGVVEIPREAYESALENALRVRADWHRADARGGSGR
ncbi:MAG: leucyl/phenylalanyl-tRNA--protein transferase [Rubricoccaceae bacterium]|nr:leucyl/phenylalanyl-tRNA--protein transferase [Rubricoccaceae bacterium]